MTEWNERQPANGAAVVTRLATQQRAFHRFLAHKLGDSALAEDILQEAFIKSLSQASTIRDEESATAWFYRVLWNTAVDHTRRRAVASRRIETFAREVEPHAEQAEMTDRTCPCVARLANAMKPEYADAVQRVEVEGLSVKDFAQNTGISRGNAAVRLFRARKALRAQLLRTCGKCANDGCASCACSTR